MPRSALRSRTGSLGSISTLKTFLDLSLGQTLPRGWDWLVVHLPLILTDFHLADGTGTKDKLWSKSIKRRRRLSLSLSLQSFCQSQPQSALMWVSVGRCQALSEALSWLTHSLTQAQATDHRPRCVYWPTHQERATLLFNVYPLASPEIVGVRCSFWGKLGIDRKAQDTLETFPTVSYLYRWRCLGLTSGFVCDTWCHQLSIEWVIYVYLPLCINWIWAKDRKSFFLVNKLIAPDIWRMKESMKMMHGMKMDVGFSFVSTFGETKIVTIH